jgi:hypothetical protein
LQTSQKKRLSSGEDDKDDGEEAADEDESATILRFLFVEPAATLALGVTLDAT